ncbi:MULTISPECIES: redox-sensitive transcriptional activator SoxR [unclassified Mesorhizobium]|jgi:MerR family redox-sensitive transcriptional activator SoxR|uniref:redox-sensitive transcriptional activator SoxR n=1 Tax=unclassified Mesorhizobium TaxID=325217 RepID=UPI0008EC1AC5|nr:MULTISPECIES: redox-sensitive transcriptional activator SoxR [unclassified Mesorhizobium]RJG44192.1 redox-sensitive transcriptional activator SoxR [Mesorhizobium sp. DCY119]SFU20042.1 MerR family transcriptional regulator, redox-sensitive transcriptional activator SoxR [Mesorhizobium sp. YR577]
MGRELSVGEVAHRSGIAVSALHFYETKGLIKSHRTGGNQRRYGQDVLRRVAVIKVAQEVGISLADISAALAALPDGRTPTREDWRVLSEGWAADLDQRILQLQKLRNGLTNCIGCGCMSIDRCPLHNADDHLSEDGPGPRLLLTASHRKSSRECGKL